MDKERPIDSRPIVERKESDRIEGELISSRVREDIEEEVLLSGLPLEQLSVVRDMLVKHHPFFRQQPRSREEKPLTS